jgi:hypothetical protein
VVETLWRFQVLPPPPELDVAVVETPCPFQVLPPPPELDVAVVQTPWPFQVLPPRRARGRGSGWAGATAHAPRRP